MGLIQWDKDLLVSLNSHHSEFWDGFMWMATDEISWMAFFAILLYLIYKQKGRQIFLVVIAIALTVLVCDQVSGLFKDWIARPRPSREPDIMNKLHIVNNYRGGRYGFFSSHAANTFGIAVLISLLLRHWLVTSILLVWAALESYSRIYLGVHYPLDILTGIAFGIITGFLVYKLYQKVSKRFLFSSKKNSNIPINSLLLVFLTTLFMMAIGAKTINTFLL